MTNMRKLREIFNNNNNETKQVIYKNSTSKYSVSAECTMEISSETAKKKKEIETNLKEVIKNYIKTPQELIEHEKMKGATVYRISHVSEILSFFGEEEGFILPMSGIKAFLLNIVLLLNGEKKIKLSFSTSEMLIFDKRSCDIYIIARALHKYYGFKNNLPGFDKKSQEIYKRLYGKNKPKGRQARLKKATLHESLACKAALARDLDSINFTLQLSTEYERSKKVLEKIKSDDEVKV